MIIFLDLDDNGSANICPSEKYGHWFIDCHDKDGHKMIIEVSTEDMNKILIEGKFLLTPDCGGDEVKH